MDHHEDKAAQMLSRTNVSTLKRQLLRLKEDLVRIRARAPNGLVVGPLRDRIREVESQIAKADRERHRSEGAEDNTDPVIGSPVQATTGHFRPRRR